MYSGNFHYFIQVKISFTPLMISTWSKQRRNCKDDAFRELSFQFHFEVRRILVPGLPHVHSLSAKLHMISPFPMSLKVSGQRWFLEKENIMNHNLFVGVQRQMPSMDHPWWKHHVIHTCLQAKRKGTVSVIIAVGLSCEDLEGEDRERFSGS
uniref:Uncharacterized protein n=1 Tax=Arundo donax TaxID=35708 RepID=A0A0A9FWM4_ARUDO